MKRRREQETYERRPAGVTLKLAEALHRAAQGDRTAATAAFLAQHDRSLADALGVALYEIEQHTREAAAAESAAERRKALRAGWSRLRSISDRSSGAWPRDGLDALSRYGAESR